MHTHLVFLRAINVGGRRVTNERLAQVATGAGFDGADTFLASGNLAVDAEGRDEAAVVATLQSALCAELGYEVEVFARNADEVAQILAREPFTAAQIAASASAPQVALLGAAPTEQLRAEAEALGTDDDRLVVIGREVHWLPVQGMARPALNLDALARLLGSLTVRTRATLQRMAKKFLGS